MFASEKTLWHYLDFHQTTPDTPKGSIRKTVSHEKSLCLAVDVYILYDRLQAGR